MGKEMTWKVGPSLWALVSGPLKGTRSSLCEGKGLLSFWLVSGNNILLLINT